MYNTVELKQERKALVRERKGLADALLTRDLSPEEQDSFQALSDKIDALTSRIDALESVQDPDDAEDRDDDKPEDEYHDKDAEEEVKKDNSKRSKVRHLSFNPQTSKTRKDSHVYSLQRALSMHTKGQRIDGLEGERDQELRNGKEDHGGFFMPLDFKLRGNHRTLQRRDLTTSSGTGSVGIRVESTFIELLRNRMVCDKLGVTIMPNCKGKFAMPRQNAASQLYWIGEGSTSTGSNPTLDQVNFVPKTASVQVNLSRKFVFESSLDAEGFIEQDLSKVLAIGLDTAVLVGNPALSGNSASPTGILYNSGVTNYTLANDIGSGADITYNDVIGWETALAVANADRGTIGTVTTPQVRGKLKSTPKINSGQVYPEFVWAPDNTLNGYPAYVTNEMLSGLTKGSGTNLYSLIYGNFEDAVLALWSGVEILVNPYINASSGAIQYNLFQEADVQLMHPQSFVTCSDISVV